MTAQYPAEAQPDIDCSSYVFIIKPELGIKIYINVVFSFCRDFCGIRFFNSKSY